MVTFSSVLQMMRDKYLDAEQKQIYGDIIVMPAEKALEEAAERAESPETDGVKSGAAEQAMQKAPPKSVTAENSQGEKGTESEETRK